MRRRTSCLAAALIWALPLPALAAGHQDGRWQLVDNRYQSSVELVISGASLSAHLGCMSIGFERNLDGRRVEEGLVIVHEGACFDSERRAPAANAYWDRIRDQIIETRSADVRRGRLVLTAADGRRLVFERVRGR